MIVVTGFVWGGFTYFVLRAVRSEKRKRTETPR